MLAPCTNCAAQLTIPSRAKGKKLRCPSCNTLVVADDLLPMAECEHCWVEFRAKLSLFGKKLKCTHCKRITTIVAKTPRIPVWCPTCAVDIQAPQAIIGWTFKCPRCTTVLKAIEKNEAEFLDYDNSDDYLVVEDIDELTSGSPAVFHPDTPPPPKVPDREKPKPIIKIASGMERGISRRKLFLADTVVPEISKPTTSESDVVKHDRTPRLPNATPTRAKPATKQPPTPVASAGAGAVGRSAEAKTPSNFKKRRKSRLADVTILTAAALFALAVSTTGGMLIWYYLDISRRSEPEPNQFRQNALPVDAID